MICVSVSSQATHKNVHRILWKKDVSTEDIICDETRIASYFNVAWLL